MRILFLGDICGRCGRESVFELLEPLKNEYRADFVIANGENASGGLGMNEKGYDELRCAGVDFFTMGNHTFDKKEIIGVFERGEEIIRPANLPQGTAGTGMEIVRVGGEKLAIINLLGRVAMRGDIESPFTAADALVEKARAVTDNIIIDIHAEATSEKQALGYYLDGRVSGVFGTHTHVQTADDCIREGGTAYITDVGMCGAYKSVLGMDVNASIARFLSGSRGMFKSAKGRGMVNAVMVEIENGKAKELVRIWRMCREK